MTKQETTEWLGRELTANEEKYFDFLVPIHRQRQDDRILVGYAWLEVPIGFLETPMTQEALDDIYGVSIDEEGVTSSKVTGRTIGEVSLQVKVSQDGTRAAFILGAREFEVGRRDYVSAEDLDDWMRDLTPFGYAVADLINKQEIGVMYNAGTM